MADSKYYINAAGNDAGTLAAALKAVGASRRAAIVERANALFGAGGPAREMSERRTQISSFGAKARGEWVRLARAFSEVRDDMWLGCALRAQESRWVCGRLTSA